MIGIHAAAAMSWPDAPSQRTPFATRAPRNDARTHRFIFNLLVDLVTATTVIELVAVFSAGVSVLLAFVAALMALGIVMHGAHPGDIPKLALVWWGLLPAAVAATVLSAKTAWREAKVSGERGRR